MTKSIDYTGPKTFVGLKSFAAKVSRDHPKAYIFAYTIFENGVVQVSSYFGKEWPGVWGAIKGYWHNGQFRPFTEKQIIAEQIACNNACE